MNRIHMKSLRSEVLLNQFAELHVIIHNQNLVRDPLSGCVAPGLHAAQFTRFGLVVGKGEPGRYLPELCLTGLGVCPVSSLPPTAATLTVLCACRIKVVPLC